MRFLGEVRPTRLLQKAERIYEGRMISGGDKKSGRPTSVIVREVCDVGEGLVRSLETNTGTLVAEGLCLHS